MEGKDVGEDDRLGRVSVVVVVVVTASVYEGRGGST